MKTTIVFYSKSGNTKCIADILAKTLGADSVELRLQKEIPDKGFLMFFLGGMSVVFKRKPKLLPYQFDPKSDLIVIGSPIWASGFCAAVRTFLSENDLSGKKVAFFVCHKGGGGEKCFEEFKKIQPNCELVSTIDFIDPLVDPDKEKYKKAAAWAEKCKEL